MFAVVSAEIIPSESYPPSGTIEMTELRYDAVSLRRSVSVNCMTSCEHVVAYGVLWLKQEGAAAKGVRPIWIQTILDHLHPFTLMRTSSELCRYIYYLDLCGRIFTYPDLSGPIT